MNRGHFAALLISIGLAAGAIPTFAAQKKGSMMSPGGGDGKMKDHDFLVSIPLITERPQARLHMELNAASEFGIALEGSMLTEAEELSAGEADKTGDSMKVSGYQGSLLISRYSDPSRLAGFFWTLGAGYRQFNADWKKKLDNSDTGLRLTEADSGGYLHHRVRGAGGTGHARVGYRWAVAEWPIAIGAHLGVRHMNSKVHDVEVSEEQQQELHLQYSPTSDQEKKSVSRREMTTRDISLEFGMIF